MRTLSKIECDLASGGRGTPIPFSRSRYIGGDNWPGGFPAAIGMVAFAGEVGWMVGTWANQRIEYEFGMTVGEAAFRTFGRK